MAELVRLTAWSFRNLSAEPVLFDRGVNLVLGHNGEGKSNLLEAISILGNLRSFRMPRLGPLVQHGLSAFRLEGEVRTDTGSCRLRQVVEIGPPLRRSLSINGAATVSSSYLQVLPVVALSRIDQELVSGSPEGRRAFLDRFTFLVEPAHYDDLVSYRQALRQRNAALGFEPGDSQLSAWDEQLATAAARVVTRRLRSAARIRSTCLEMYERLRGSHFPNVEVSYRVDSWLQGVLENDGEGINPDAIAHGYRERFLAVRERDLRRGHTGDGPHRHDLLLVAEKRPAREVLSSGQTKVLAAALRLAALQQVESSRDESLPVIIDDVDAELDGEALLRLIDLLGEQRQLFFSSAHDEMVASRLSPSARLLMNRGACIRDLESGEQR